MPALTMTHDGLQERLAPVLEKSELAKLTLQIYKLWFEVNQSRPFFLFDFAAVLGALSDTTPFFTWVNAKCGFGYDVTLTLHPETKEGAAAPYEGAAPGAMQLRVAAADLTEAQVEAHWAKLLEVFQQ